MQSLVDDVSAFHHVTDTPVLTEPQFPSDDRIILRLALIREETRETIAALEAAYISSELDEPPGDLEETADGIIDAIYVLVGTGIELGLPMQALWDEVQRANMAKAIEQPDGTFRVMKRADGKVLKPEGWEPPDIRGVLLAHGWQPPAPAEVKGLDGPPSSPPAPDAPDTSGVP